MRTHSIALGQNGSVGVPQVCSKTSGSRSMAMSQRTPSNCPAILCSSPLPLVLPRWSGAPVPSYLGRAIVIVATEGGVLHSGYEKSTRHRRDPAKQRAPPGDE